MLKIKKGLIYADNDTTTSQFPVTTNNATTVSPTSSQSTTPRVPYGPSNEPLINLYTLKYKDGGYCIMLKAALRLALQFKNFNDKKV